MKGGKGIFKAGKKTPVKATRVTAQSRSPGTRPVSTLSWWKSVISLIVSRFRIVYGRVRADIRKRKEQRLTIMFIPHNEQSIRNYHISNLTLTIIISSLVLIVMISSVLIITHNSTVQEVDKLRISQKDAKIQFAKIRSEIRALSTTYSDIRASIYKLHQLSGGEKAAEALFGQGGNSMPAIPEVSNDSPESVPLEIFMMNRVLNELEISEKPLRELGSFIKRREKIIKNTPTLWPVKGALINPFGLVRHAGTFNVIQSRGADISVFPGSKVSATAPGVVSSVERDARWMWVVRIRHTYGYETVYKGLERVVVRADEKVVKGEEIGFTGYPQDSLESILRYEIFIGAEAVDPLPYLSYISHTYGK